MAPSPWERAPPDRPAIAPDSPSAVPPPQPQPPPLPPPPPPDSGSVAAEMDALLGELAGADILQVIKTMEAAGVDQMLPAAVTVTATAGPDATAEAVKAAQRRLARRLDFLHRRLRLLQARTVATHGAEEARALLAPSAPAPCPASGPAGGVSRAAARALVRRLERGVGAGGGGDAGLGGQGARPDGHGAGACSLQLRSLEARLDSEATLSSSGAESADEPVPYANPYQHPMPLKKRAMWKWVNERGSIASRWSWLQTKVQEIEYRIKQHTELLRRIRATKGSAFPAEPSGYSGPLPGSSVDNADSYESARMRPLFRPGFKKRRLLQLLNLHTAAEAAAKPSDVRCICQWPLSGCAVCTGRIMPMHPLPYSSCLTQKQRLSLVDPAFHPVLSSVRDVSTTIHYSSIMKDPQWQMKSSRGTIRSLKGNSPLLPLSSKIQQIPNPSNMKKRNRNNRIKCSKPMVPVISGREGVTGNVIKADSRRTSLQEPGKDIVSDVDRSSPLPQQSGGSSPLPSPFDTHKQRARERERFRINSSYDIDNIVIPHSIAASTKVEVLQYKEILTPKWRVVEAETTNGIIGENSCPADGHDSEEEDLSDASVLLRHEKCEALERGKYMRDRKNPRRRGTSSTTPLTPSETPPHTPAPMVVDETSMTSDGGQIPINQGNMNMLPMVSGNTLNLDVSSPPSLDNSMSSVNAMPRRRATDELVEIIQPYSPRTFPLNDDAYGKMLKVMPENHPLSIEMATPYRRSSAFSCTPGSDSDSNSNSQHAFSSVSNPVVNTNTVAPEPCSETEGSDSPSIPPEEDPNDPEWNISDCAESVHHR